MKDRLELIVYDAVVSHVAITNPIGDRGQKKISYYRMAGRTPYNYMVERTHPLFITLASRIGFFDPDTKIEIDFYIDPCPGSYSLAAIIFNSSKQYGYVGAQRDFEAHICRFHRKKVLQHKLKSTGIRHMAKVARALINTFTFISIQLRMQAESRKQEQVKFDNNIIRKAIKEFKLNKKQEKHHGTKRAGRNQGSGRSTGLGDQGSAAPVGSSTVAEQDRLHVAHG